MRVVFLVAVLLNGVLIEARGRGRRIKPVFDAAKPVLTDTEGENINMEKESKREREGKSKQKK